MRTVPSLLAAAALIAATGCAPDSSEEAEPHGEAQTASVETVDFRFSPRTVEVEPGKAVTLTIRNTGRASHSFTTDDAPVDVVVKPGESRGVTITPTGPLSFFCRFHQSDGMKGVLCVRGEECTPPLFP